MERSSGVLMHISSLPNDYGIGSFGQAAYDFVDFLSDTKQKYWQILPLTTTSYGDSPYQSFSAYAGNPYFIDLDILQKEGLKGIDFGQDSESVDYAVIFRSRQAILEKAVQRFKNADLSISYQQFVQENQAWLNPFAEYMAIKETFDLKAWYEWDEPARKREANAMARYRLDLAERLDYYRITQFFFYQQWQALKAYANQKGIEIIGDMPIYVARDSVEMWTQPELFKVDREGNPTLVAGTPPDNFSAEGQFWGNPIYDWEYHRQQNYAWWIQRFKESFKLYDWVRIDHFRGFESFWQVPLSAETSAEGEWSKGPGYDLFAAVKEVLGDLNIIAEDLGFMTPEVIAMREATGFPGMKILQFGFDEVGDSPDLPHHYPLNSIAYVGTHDNEIAKGWALDSASSESLNKLEAYLGHFEGESIADSLNRGIAMSRSCLAIYRMQDLLNLDNRSRMNKPSTLGGNWKWRMTKEQLTEELKSKLINLTQTYYRENK
ncbi:4-alpha-glucanotransferase [Facklamia miroungae]|uniref:4-alpha-glucanotransferase n=1 Tax=Facklamia miroungae TaxID=120956 RepID=A0A1G7T872_9LACT|nr:4-alpha-glucanotransferase [Facklamia miroungae]NKZ29709.1 4-alpha-glucanotransferase [Facklamia miroungae]SDG31513.1 4-alpha-glucanotransferase [Facklamia miroungae]